MVVLLLKTAVPDGHTIGQLPVTVFRHALMNRGGLESGHRPGAYPAGLDHHLRPAGAGRQPLETVADLLRLGERVSDELLLGSTGVGSTLHLAMEELLLDHGIRYTHVLLQGHD